MYRSSSSLLIVSLLTIFATVFAQGFGGGTTVNATTITNFGKNPTNCTMKFFKPAGATAGTKLPMVVAPHYCGANANSGESWYKLTPKSTGSTLFYVLFPENSRSGGCWAPWDADAQKHDVGGDTLGVAEMVRYAIKNLDVDPARVYITGFSSGASMASAMAATYPELFEGVASFSGVTPGCVDSAVAGGGGFGRPTGGATTTVAATCFGSTNTSMSIEDWTKNVRAMYPGFKGRYPRAMIYHGDKDEVINNKYFFEEIKIWQGVHGLSGTIPTTPARTKLGGSADQAMIEAVYMSGTHALTYQTDAVLKFFGIGVSGFVPPKDADGALPPGSGSTPTGPATDPCQTSGCDTTNGACSSSTGQAVCSCKTGFQLGADKKSCTAVTAANACATNNGGCATNAVCTPTANTRTCTCNAGFTGNGVTCTASTNPPTTGNACAANNGGCSANAVCTPTATSRTCACNAGYTGNGVSCTVATNPDPTGNACDEDNGGCSPDATCTPTATSRTCACNAGFSGNGVTCTARATNTSNQCATGNGGCSQNANCGVSGGAVRCTCKSGYSGDGKTCTRNQTPTPGTSDPCETDNGGCAPDATCSSNGNTVSCACNQGFQGNGWSCEVTKTATTTQDSSKASSGISPVVIIVAIVGALLLLGGGYYFFCRGDRKNGAMSPYGVPQQQGPTSGPYTNMEMPTQYGGPRPPAPPQQYAPQ